MLWIYGFGTPKNPGGGGGGIGAFGPSKGIPMLYYEMR